MQMRKNEIRKVDISITHSYGHLEFITIAACGYLDRSAVVVGKVIYERYKIRIIISTHPLQSRCEIAEEKPESALQSF